MPLTESFYDLGGDSLSALTVILRMEGMGLDPETARGIFKGRTIADLAGLGGVPATPAETVPVDAAPGSGLGLADSMNAVHATRGVLVLWVVTVHWLPEVLARAPGDYRGLLEAITPLLRFGTPGFAIVFGLGVGALGIPQYLRNRHAYVRGARLKAALVVGGVVMLALVNFILLWSRGDISNPNRLSVFYSAIAYYALMLLALPWLMRLLTRWSYIPVTILAAMVGSMAVNEILLAFVAPYRVDGLAELGKLLLTAKYGFFRMTGYVLGLGPAIGDPSGPITRAPGIVGALTATGAALVGMGFLVAFKARPDAIFADVGDVLPWHLTIYLGLATLILAGFCALNRGGGDHLPRPVAVANALLIATGILALPIYVGHEMVLPVKALLYEAGMIEMAAIAILVGAFLGALSVGYVRLLRFLLG